jgi:hypothetical protein
MSSYTNGSAGPEKVMFKIEGKTYNNGTQEGTAVDNATSTFYPFDEVTVAAGATVDLGDSTIVKVVALDSAAAAPSRVGDTGDIANTDPAYDLKVMFKEDGKTYNNGTQEGAATDNATSTFYPFDEALVPPGKKFNSTGTKVVKTVVMVPGPATPPIDYSGA